MSRWSERHDVVRGDSYDDRWREMESKGLPVHGEADCIEAMSPASVLDAGCGTGRVGIELAARGIEVVGVDLDAAMLETARSKAPDLHWVQDDLANVTVVDTAGERRRFDAVAMAGNVMIFVTPGTEADVVANLALHVRPGGLLIAGFQLHEDRLDLAQYDAMCRSVGLELRDRWSTWGRDPYAAGGAYAVSVHQLGDHVE